MLRSNNRVAGELRYTQGDLTLTLYGGLSKATVESPFMATPDQTEHSLVYGDSEDGTSITVIKPFYTKWKPDTNERRAWSKTSEEGSKPDEVG
ncbi:MAG: hypothetical protein KDD60_10230 [Bdellovibrionales bacterium]|nr:hypothetical protein [Bdellovibrionales bacterium]